MQIFLHDALEYERVILQPEHLERVGQRLPRNDRKILVAPHQRTQPGIFQLLDAPDLGDDLAVAGKRLLGDGRHRLDVVERPIGVEHNGFDGHSAFAFSARLVAKKFVQRIARLIRRGFVVFEAMPEKLDSASAGRGRRRRDGRRDRRSAGPERPGPCRGIFPSRRGRPPCCGTPAPGSSRRVRRSGSGWARSCCPWIQGSADRTRWRRGTCSCDVFSIAPCSTEASASQPPCENPSTAIRAGSTNGCRTRKFKARYASKARSTGAPLLQVFLMPRGPKLSTVSVT